MFLFFDADFWVIMVAEFFLEGFVVSELQDGSIPRINP